MTLSDWIMSCQPGPPRARYGQWPRWQQRPVGYTFPYKMANFHGVYLKLGRINSTKCFIWHSEKYLSHCHKISKWYDESVICYHRVKISNFAMSKQGPSHYFQRHARAPPTAMPGCVDARMLGYDTTLPLFKMNRLLSMLLQHILYDNSTIIMYFFKAVDLFNLMFEMITSHL